MSLFIETIKCKEGKLYNLSCHQARFNRTRKEYLGLSTHSELAEMIAVPQACKTGLFRCRMLYSEKIEKTEFIPHAYQETGSLKLVEDPAIHYPYKFADRRRLDQLFRMREDCDDIIIVKNNRITDSSRANIVFYDGREWWTPDTPLLPGTQRARLIDEGKIRACSISVSDLRHFEKAGLINAMLSWDKMPLVEVKNIL